MSLSGDSCGTVSKPAAVLVAVQSPTGSTLTSISAVPTYGSWNTSVPIPGTAWPSPDYRIVASCDGTRRSSYNPINFTIASSTGAPLTVTHSVVKPGKAVSVSGAACSQPQGSVGPISVQVALTDNRSNVVAVAAVTPAKSGSWTAHLKVPSSSSRGVFQIDATCDVYVSSTQYLAQSLYVQRSSSSVPTELAYSGTTKGAAGSAVTLSAQLTARGEPLAGMRVRFALGSSTTSATTGTNGVAEAIVTVPKSGATSASASFPGGSRLGASTSKAKFTATVAHKASKLAVSAPASSRSGRDVIVSATLLTPTGKPITGRPITFTVINYPGYSQASAALTDKDGVATYKFYLYERTEVVASFDGSFDTTYASASASKVIKLKA